MANATYASRFASLRDELARRVRTEWQNPSGRYQSVQAIEREVLKDSADDVREIFRTAKSAQDERGPAGKKKDSAPQGTRMGSPEDAFFWRVFGDPPECSRARIFTLLLFLEVEPLSNLWGKFISSLGLHPEGEPHPGFRDAELPLEPRDIVKFLGANITNRFDEAQHRYYPVDIKPHFDEIMKKLRHAVAERKVECKDLDGHDEREPNDVFWPDPVAPMIVEKYEDSISKLYEEAFKAKLKPPDPGDFEWNRKTYRELREVKRDAAKFYKGVQSCSKAFAILTQVPLSPDSKMWRRFEAYCMDPQRSPLGITDEELPLDYDPVKRRFGDNDSDNQLFWNLQFSFCVPTLREGKNIHYSPRDGLLHLPIRERKLIKEGGGSQGAVYCVKIEPDHFRLEKNAEYLAMKRAHITKDNANEWENLKTFFTQPMKHESIMIPRASLSTEEQIYIFSDKADCNLDDYMEDDHRNANGPLDLDDAIQHLSTMAGVAGALEYLHRWLVGDEFLETIVMYHLDVKAANVLVTKKADGRLLFQLTDFGISSMKPTPEDWKPSRDSRLIRAQRTRLRLGSGNPNTPPEATETDQVDSKADVWAFGALLARFTAWLAGGKQTMMEFEKSRGGREVDGIIEEKEFFTVRSDTKQPNLHEGVGRFFEDLIGGINGDTEHKRKLFYESLWWTLQKRLLVCSKDARADIREIPKILRQILRSKKIDGFEQDIRLKIPSTVASTNELSDSPDTQGPSASTALTLPYHGTTEVGHPGRNEAEPHRTDTGGTAVNDTTLTDAEIDQNNLEIVQRNSELNQTPRAESVPNDPDAQQANMGVIAGSEPDSVHNLTQTGEHQAFPPRTSVDSTQTEPMPRQWTHSDNDAHLSELRSASTAPAGPSPSGDILPRLQNGSAAVATPNSRSRTSRTGSAPQRLVSAIKSGNKPAFDHALTHTTSTGLRQHVNGCTALEHAFKYGQLDMAKDLIDKGADINVVHATHGTLLHRAARSGHVEMARLLLEHGIDVNVKDGMGISALSKICQLERRPDRFEDMLNCLLEVLGVDLDARDDNDATPLIRAAKHGDEWAVTMLLEAGASLCVEDSDGCNPLHGAVRVEGATITKALLATDTESKLIAMKDDQGRTALHACADLGTKQALENARLLVECGADVNAEDYDTGDTPLDLINGQSETREHSNMAEFLLEKGALVTDKIRGSRKAPFKVIQNHMKGQPRSASR